jgi:hypothetical protein
MSTITINGIALPDADLYEGPDGEAWAPENEAEWQAAFALRDRITELAEQRADAYLFALDQGRPTSYLELDHVSGVLGLPQERQQPVNRGWQWRADLEIVPCFKAVNKTQYSGCDPEYTEYRIPYAVLWDLEGTIMAARRARDADTARLAAAEKIAAKTRRAAAERQERVEYRRLQAKFGPSLQPQGVDQVVPVRPS